MTDIVGIVAVARNGVIGADGGMPWHLPEDLKRFRRLTSGHVLVLGRKTHEAIGRPLPGRTTLVVTRDRNWHADGVRPVASVPEALDLGRELDPTVVFVAGGGQVYRAAWPRLMRLEVTEVDAAPEGDVTFPEIEPTVWRETAREERPGFAWVSYRRRSAG